MKYRILYLIDSIVYNSYYYNIAWAPIKVIVMN